MAMIDSRSTPMLIVRWWRVVGGNRHVIWQSAGIVNKGDAWVWALSFVPPLHMTCKIRSVANGTVFVDIEL